MKKKVCFITVNYNNALITKDFIDNIKSLELKNLTKEIVVVDNLSSTDDKEKLVFQNELSTFISVIYSHTNLGYFGGLNLGIESIDPSKFDYIIICNNDLNFDRNFLDILYNIDFDKETYVIAPDIETLDGVHQNPLRIDRISKIELLKNDIYYSNYYIMLFFKKITNLIWGNKPDVKNFDKEEKYIDAGIGACYVLTKNFFRFNSILKNEVFLWGEEAVFSQQIRETSGKILYSPNLHVTHLESKSVSKIPPKDRYSIVQSSYKRYRNYL